MGWFLTLISLMKLIAFNEDTVFDYFLVTLVLSVMFREAYNHVWAQIHREG